MKFAGKVWRLLVGIKDGLVLLLMLLFFGLLWAMMSARPTVGSGDKGALYLDLSGPIVEQPSQAKASDVVRGAGGVRATRLRDLVKALQTAATDDRVQAVALDLDIFTGGGQTTLSDAGAAIDAVKKAGKPVLAYATAYDDQSYLLASHASEVWLSPMGGVLITGPGHTNLYYKGLLDKLGVTANVYRVGTYKAAVEPYIRNDMSPEARQNYTALDQARLENWRQEVRQARPKANVDLFLTNMNGAIAAAGGDMAKAALQAGLVDRIGDRHAFETRLADLSGGEGSGGAPFREIKLGSYVANVVDRKPSGP